MRCGVAVALSLLLGWGGSALAATADINLNDNSARFAYSSFVGGVPGGRSLFDAGFLYNNDDVTVTHVGLHVVDLVGAKTPGLQVGVGGRMYYANGSSRDTLALALGGELEWRPAQVQRVGFAVNFHYAPGIVTFIDGDRLAETGARIDYRLLEHARVYLGYRNIVVNMSKARDRVDEGAHVGLAIDF